MVNGHSHHNMVANETTKLLLSADDNSSCSSTVSTKSYYYGKDNEKQILIQTPTITKSDDNYCTGETTSSIGRRILIGVILSFILVITTSRLNVYFSRPRYIHHQLHHHSTSTNKKQCSPENIHLSQYDNVNPETDTVSMTMSFTLSYHSCDTRNTIPVVYYRPLYAFQEKEALFIRENQFNFTSSKDPFDFYESDYIYHMKIPDLKAGLQQYYYRIVLMNAQNSGTYQQESFSQPSYTFWTPPSYHTPTRIAFVGDLGQTKNSATNVEHIMEGTPLGYRNNPGGIVGSFRNIIASITGGSTTAADEYDTNPSSDILYEQPAISLMHLAGDISYADSEPVRWISWFEMMQPLLFSIPIHVAAGNHEIECNEETNMVFEFYENYFSNPNRIDEPDIVPITDQYRQQLLPKGCSKPGDFRSHYDYGNSFYSYHHGLVHVIVLNSYAEIHKDSAQYKWLVEELSTKFDRKLTPWLVVSFHAPYYTTFIGHNFDIEPQKMKHAIEHLLIEYKVNLVFTGHDHGYMRTKSLSIDHDIDNTGHSPIYMTVGEGGNREDHAVGYLHPFRQEEWVAKRDLRDYGYANLYFKNATHLLHNWVQVNDEPEVNDDNEQMGIHDHVWIYNHHYDDNDNDDDDEKQ